jgi:small nuclear ribonucleoprotein
MYIWDNWCFKMVMPQNLLEKTLNKQVAIKLKDGRLMEGKLVGYDEYMNMVLEGTEEETKEEKRRLGTVILRGNNVVSISPKM